MTNYAAVQDVELRARNGECVGLLGPKRQQNGALDDAWRQRHVTTRADLSAEDLALESQKKGPGRGIDRGL